MIDFSAQFIFLNKKLIIFPTEPLNLTNIFPQLVIGLAAVSHFANITSIYSLNNKLLKKNIFFKYILYFEFLTTFNFSTFQNTIWPIKVNISIAIPL